VGCRGRAGKGEFVRVVRQPAGQVSVDPTGRSPGRGAYVHRAESCVRQAVRRGALAKALKASLDDAEVSRLMDELASGSGDER
jgi:predicted RNA-binding protein YlxR (DUF448 family)